MTGCCLTPVAHRDLAAGGGGFPAGELLDRYRAYMDRDPIPFPRGCGYERGDWVYVACGRAFVALLGRVAVLPQRTTG